VLYRELSPKREVHPSPPADIPFLVSRPAPGTRGDLYRAPFSPSAMPPFLAHLTLVRRTFFSVQLLISPHPLCELASCSNTFAAPFPKIPPAKVLLELPLPPFQMVFFSNLPGPLSHSPSEETVSLPSSFPLLILDLRLYLFVSPPSQYLFLSSGIRDIREHPPRGSLPSFRTFTFLSSFSLSRRLFNIPSVRVLPADCFCSPSPVPPSNSRIGHFLPYSRVFFSHAALRDPRERLCFRGRASDSDSSPRHSPYFFCIDV